VLYAQGKTVEERILTSDDIVFEVEFYNNLAESIVDVTFDLHNLQGIHVAHVGTICNEEGLPGGWYKTTGVLPGNILNIDRYIFSVQFGRNQRELLFRIDETLTFDVDDGIENRGSKYSRLPGVIHPRCEWSTQNI
jgi:lipopolysaccharide transport system ATP-binding protein